MRHDRVALRNTLGMTHSVCETCRRMVPAKIVSEGGDVYFEKFCTEHGASRCLVRRDVEDYLRTLRYVKPAWIPQTSSGDAAAACPEGCGFCQRHEQHLCMPIVEITTRCDLACPICLVDAGRPWDISLAEFTRLLDVLIAAERQIDILNLSGGEPLVHPELLALVDAALARPEIVRVSISTNGLALLRSADLLDRLRQRNVVVSLQFDGFRDEPYEVLRGRRLLAEKLRVLELLRAAGVTTSLVMTAAGGVSDDQFPAVLDYFFTQPHVVSLMIQPLAFAGRGRHLNAAQRLTIPDVVRLLASAGVPEVQAEDFVPLPCSHPLCFSLAFYLMLEGGGMVSMRRLVDAAKWLDAITNRTVFGLDEEEHERMKDMIYDLWSGPAGAAPDSEAVMRTLRGILDEMAAGRFDARQAFSITERRVKSIFIHAFQDADTFDLARARRCCNGYPQPDGRVMPACVHNVLGRNHRSPVSLGEGGNHRSPLPPGEG
jgi:7,8-dihydro-6-hydroxymethylpterin dimethyltransferase